MSSSVCPLPATRVMGVSTEMRVPALTMRPSLDIVNPVFLSVDELGGGEGEAEGGQARLGFTQRAVVGYVGQGDGGLRARVEREEYGAAGLDILACLDRLPE